MIIKGIVRRGRWVYDAEQNVATGEVTWYDRDGENPQPADEVLARTFQAAKGQVGYTPAQDALEAARARYEDAKAVFTRLETASLGELTKQQLMDTGDVGIHESYTKAELVEDAVGIRWRRREEFKAWDALEDAAKSEAAIIHLIQQSRLELNNYLSQVVSTAMERDVHNMLKCTSAVRREWVYYELWVRVAELSTPEQMTPVEALRAVVYEAANKALDDLEDRTQDLTDARHRARWVRKYGDLVGLRELQG